MPSFDVVSEVDMHELHNAIDQTVRDIGTRFDFKGSSSKVEHADTTITLTGDNPFQVQQILDILLAKMAKRGLDVACLDIPEAEISGSVARQKITVRQGIDKETAKKVVKQIKDSQIKVQAAIQGEQVRVTGKKRDDLQQVMALLRTAKLELPLQFNNFRD